MKKIYCFLILAIVLLPIVNAGKTFELDFNTKDSFPLVMDKGDRILFEYGGYNHTIILDEIKNNVIELDVFLFLEGDLHTPNYVSLTDKYNVRIDFDKDGKKELEIGYGSFDPKNKKANVVFKRLEAWDKNVKLTPFWEIENTESNKSKDKVKYYLMGGLVVLIIILFILGVKYKRKDGTYF